MKCSTVRLLKAILHESECWGFVLTIVPCMSTRMRQVTGMYWKEEYWNDSADLSSAKSVCFFL